MESSCGKVYVRQRNPNGGGGTGVLRELNVTSDADGERYLVAKNEVDRKKKRRWFNSDCDQVRPYNPKGELLGLAECCVAFVSAHLDLLESLQDRVEPIAGVGVAGVDSLAKLVGVLLELESRDSRVLSLELPLLLTLLESESAQLYCRIFPRRLEAGYGGGRSATETASAISVSSRRRTLARSFQTAASPGERLMIGLSLNARKSCTQFCIIPLV